MRNTSARIILGLVLLITVSPCFSTEQFVENKDKLNTLVRNDAILRHLSISKEGCIN